MNILNNSPAENVVVSCPGLRKGPVADLVTALGIDNPELVKALYDVAPFRITNGLKRAEDAPRASGGFGVIYFGELQQEKTVEKVAIKVLKNGCNIPISRILMRLIREIRVWSGLDHANIISFRGFEIDPALQSVTLICPWAEHGDIQTYLKRNPVSRQQKMLFVRDTIDGLIYLHSKGVFHGDLKAANVLIVKEIRAVLCDFGVSRFTNPLDSSSGSDPQSPEKSVSSNLTTSDGFQGTCRWTSPEQFNSPTLLRSFSSDMWSWGMTALEIMTGKTPYHEIQDHVVLCIAISQGHTPDPHHYPALPTSDNFWKLLNLCWKNQPKSRLALGVIKRHLVLLIQEETTPRQTGPLSQVGTGSFSEAQVKRMDERFRLATSLQEDGCYLQRIGRHAEALSQLEEALARWKALGERCWASFWLDCVRSHQSLSTSLAAVGRLPDALSCALDGDHLLRIDSLASQSDCAASLNKLSCRLADVGRRDEALKKVEEAIAIHGGQVEGDLGSTLCLLSCLLTHSLRLGDLGRWDDAVDSARKAYGLASAPDVAAAEQGALPSVLDRLSLCLVGQGRYEEAFHHVRRATDIWRALAKTDPAAFRFHLAASLALYDECLGLMRTLEEAKSADARRSALVPSEQNPQPPSPSDTPYHHSESLWNIDRYREALQCITEAMVLNQKPSSERPEQVTQQIVFEAASRTLIVLRPFVYKNHDGFRTDLIDAVKRLREPIRRQHDPKRSLIDLPAEVALDDERVGAKPLKKLCELSQWLLQKGRGLEALRTSKQALAMSEEIEKIHHNERSRHYLALCLHITSNCLSKCGYEAEAVKLGLDAVDTYKTLSHQNPHTFRSRYVSTAERLVDHLQLVGNREVALRVWKEVVETQRRVSTRTLRDQMGIVKALHKLSRVLAKSGDYHESLDAAEEASNLCCALAEREPTALDLVFWQRRTLERLLGCCETLGMLEKAESIREELTMINQNALSGHEDSSRF